MAHQLWNLLRPLVYLYACMHINNHPANPQHVCLEALGHSSWDTSFAAQPGYQAASPPIAVAVDTWLHLWAIVAIVATRYSKNISHHIFRSPWWIKENLFWPSLFARAMVPSKKQSPNPYDKLINCIDTTFPRNGVALVKRSVDKNGQRRVVTWREYGFRRIGPVRVCGWFMGECWWYSIYDLNYCFSCIGGSTDFSG